MYVSLDEMQKYACMHACMYVCINVCTYVCMYVLVTILNATLSIESVDRATGGLLLLFDLIFLGGASQEFRTTRSHGMAYNAPPNPYSLGEDFDGSHGGPGVKKGMSRDWRGYGVFAEVAESAWSSYRYCFSSVPSLPASLPSFSLHQPIHKLSLSLSLSLSLFFGLISSFPVLPCEPMRPMFRGEPESY
jgi:hypothetical protein